MTWQCMRCREAYPSEGFPPSDGMIAVCRCGGRVFTRIAPPAVPMSDEWREWFARYADKIAPDQRGILRARMDKGCRPPSGSPTEMCALCGESPGRTTSGSGGAENCGLYVPECPIFGVGGPAQTWRVRTARELGIGVAMSGETSLASQVVRWAEQSPDPFAAILRAERWVAAMAAAGRQPAEIHPHQESWSEIRVRHPAQQHRREKMISFYLGTGLEHAPEAMAWIGAMEADGLVCTYAWPEVAIGVQDSHADRGVSLGLLRAIGMAEREAVLSADVVVIVLPGGHGTHAELGMALARADQGMPLFVVHEVGADPRCPFALLHSATFVDEHPAMVQALILQDEISSALLAGHTVIRVLYSVPAGHNRRDRVSLACQAIARSVLFWKKNRGS